MRSRPWAWWCWAPGRWRARSCAWPGSSRARWRTWTPAALLPALVVVNTFAGDRRLVLDARAVGLAVAALAVWRKAPFVVVVGGAVAATALTRAIA